MCFLISRVERNIMAQEALLVAVVGIAAFFALIPVSIWLLKDVLSGETGEAVDEIETTDQSEQPRSGRGSGA